MIKLRDLLKDPKGLSVHLFFEIGRLDIPNLKLLTNSDHGQQISKTASVVLMSLGRVFDESLNLAIHLLLNFWVEFKQKSEKSDEVNHTSDG